MNNKCEWKYGNFYGCNDFNPGHRVNKNKILVSIVSSEYEIITVCKSCGVDIRKPESEVIIKKSGETWVAREKGIDYLCTEPENFHDHINDGIGEVTPEHFFKSHHDCWKPISEIKITDDIAKLRPMVVCDMQNSIFKLYGIYSDAKDDFKYIGHGSMDMTLWQDCRLATVDDL